jgi:type IV pilus assembly protein PilV
MNLFNLYNTQKPKMQLSQRKRSRLMLMPLSQKGFTLIEVMVAVFVLAVGILGMAGMQAVSVRESQNSVFRSQADILAADMADRLRANRADAADELSTNYETDGTLGDLPNCMGTTANCDETDIAGYDIFQWQTQIVNSNLPAGVGTITRNAGTSEYTILVFWDEDRDGAVTTGTSCNSTAADGCIRLVIQI